MSSTVFYFVCVSCVLNVARSQDQARLTINKERVYDKESFTLTCSFLPGLSFTSVALEAFDNTSVKGSMYCDVLSGASTPTGVFTGSTFAGCPTYLGGSGYVSVTMQASSTLELDYNCTLGVTDGAKFYTLRSSTTHFELSVMPEPVYLNHRVLNFNDSDHVTLACHSRYGKPPAVVNLTVTQQDRSPLQHIGNAPLFQLPEPLRSWNNATVTCTVENHNFSQNMTYHGVLNIHFFAGPIVLNRDADTTWSSANLDCSALSNPPAIYSWKIPPGIPVQFSGPHNDSIVVPRGTSDTFICTVSNAVLGKQVDVTFDATSYVSVIVGVVITACITIGAIVVLILYKQGRLPNGCKPPDYSRAQTKSSED